jgi:hypothetical protein
MMKVAKDFQAHIELRGLFEVFVIQAPDGTRLQIYPPTKGQVGFQEYLAKRFGHLGEPTECVHHADFDCYEVFFRGLRFSGPEEALSRLTAGR